MHKAAIHILQPVLVNHFYKVNAGFFLFCFFILFGVVSGGQLISYHLSLIQGMIGSPVFLSCVIFIWLLYTFKCVNYIARQISDPRQTFLFVLNTLPGSKQFRLMLFVHLMVYMPVLIYAMIVAGVAAKQHHFGAMTAVIISNVLMIGLSAYLYTSYLGKRVTGIHFSIPGITLPKPFFLVPLWFIWKERKQMLLVTKLFSFALLYGFINLYEPDKPDARPLLLIMMLIATAHSAITLHIRSFEEDRFAFSKQFPVSLPKRFGFLLILYLLLLSPELLFMWKGFPLHFRLRDLPQIVLLTTSIPCFFYSILLMNDTDAKGYYRVVFLTCAVLFFVLLYDPGILLPAFIAGISFVLFHSHFYTFEKRYI
ncbi:MAG: hypothetical protein ABI581_09280 [Sediminibacterium sp.]